MQFSTKLREQVYCSYLSILMKEKVADPHAVLIQKRLKSSILCLEHGPADDDTGLSEWE